MLRINLNILECKFYYKLVFIVIKICSINLNILECKFQFRLVCNRFFYSINLNILECKFYICFFCVYTH